MNIIKTKFGKVLILQPQYFEDDRGYFVETFSKIIWEDIMGFKIDFIQDSLAFSHFAGTFRGIHCQIHPKAQDKLVWCISGSILDFIIDLRKESKTYKQWISIEISRMNRKQIYIPAGFGHAYITLEDNTEVAYKFNKEYDEEYARSISFLDSSINLEIKETITNISKKDMNAKLLDQLDIKF